MTKIHHFQSVPQFCLIWLKEDRSGPSKQVRQDAEFLRGFAAERQTMRGDREGETMSAVAFIFTIYLIVSLFVMIAFCRAAAHGDRVLDR
ncbi:MAG: hypothetical protein ACNA7O_15655 [Rhodobacterales bacterium]